MSYSPRDLGVRDSLTFFLLPFFRAVCLSRIISISLRNISKPKLTSVFLVAKEQSISSFKSICVKVFIIPTFNLVIISVNDLFWEIFKNSKLGKMVRNISCRIARSTLMFMIVEENVINEGCRLLNYFRGKGYLRNGIICMTSKNGFTPVICLYLIRFKFKSPTIKLLLFSRLILLSGFFIISLLNLKCCMLGCL